MTDHQIVRFEDARSTLRDAEKALADAAADAERARREFITAASALAERVRLAPVLPSPQLALDELPADVVNG